MMQNGWQLFRPGFDESGFFSSRYLVAETPSLNAGILFSDSGMQACSFGMEGPLMFLAWFAPNLFLLTASTSGCANTIVIPVRPGRRHIVTHLCGSPQRPFLGKYQSAP